MAVGSASRITSAFTPPAFCSATIRDISAPDPAATTCTLLPGEAAWNAFAKASPFSVVSAPYTVIVPAAGLAAADPEVAGFAETDAEAGFATADADTAVEAAGFTEAAGALAGALAGAAPPPQPARKNQPINVEARTRVFTELAYATTSRSLRIDSSVRRLPLR